MDRLVELALFAPVGLLLTVRESLPEWIDKGRRQLAAQVPLARTVGQMAVRHGTRQAREGLERLRRQADGLLDDMAGGADEPPESRPARAEPEPVLSQVDADRPQAPSAPAPGAPGGEMPEQGEEDEDDVVPEELRASFGPPGVPPDAGELPIPGYDTLSASQVVQRLPGLSMEELEAVRSYELAGRARKTVLLRVAQLRAAS